MRTMMLATISEFGPQAARLGIRSESAADGNSPHRSVRGGGMSTPLGIARLGTNGLGVGAVIKLVVVCCGLTTADGVIVGGCDAGAVVLGLGLVRYASNASLS